MRGEDAEKEAEHRDERDGDEHQLEGCGERGSEVFGHRPVGVEGDAEIAMGGIDEKLPVLGHDRLVETQPIAQRLHLRRRRVRTQCQAGRIPRNHAGEQEDQDRHPDQHDHAGEEARAEEAQRVHES